LDFSVNEDFGILDKYKIEFVDPKILYKDTKIVVISASEAEIWLIMCFDGHFGSHIGGHLGF
jgi:hypothetical protein